MGRAERRLRPVSSLSFRNVTIDRRLGRTGLGSLPTLDLATGGFGRHTLGLTLSVRCASLMPHATLRILPRYPWERASTQHTAELNVCNCVVGAMTPP
jgi:hypothetical protein